MCVLPRWLSGKELPANAGLSGLILGKDPPEREMAAHPNILVWIIPGKEKPVRLQFMGSKESDTTEHKLLIIDIVKKVHEL